jgi:hypothetical protein
VFKVKSGIGGCAYRLIHPTFTRAPGPSWGVGRAAGQYPPPTGYFAAQGFIGFAAQGLAAHGFMAFAAQGLAAQGFMAFAAQGLAAHGFIGFAAQGFIGFAAQGLAA